LIKTKLTCVADPQPAFIGDFHAFVAKSDEDVSAMQVPLAYIYMMTYENKLPWNANSARVRHDIVEK
jgi:hypothetical protein